VGLYELAILGEPSPDQRNQVRDTLAELVAPFNLIIGTEIVLYDAASVPSTPSHTAFAAVYFSGPKQAEAVMARQLLSMGVPVIPVPPVGGKFTDLPAGLQGANGMALRSEDPELVELASALLECVGLLRKQRRAFVSYRRTESRNAAAQIHDLLAGKAFDVFLDTHDIRPGDPFQEVLWHRLCDSDVMVMLDTDTYFSSSWTRQELARARAKDIQVLRVVWPGRSPDVRTSLAETVYLGAGDLKGTDGPIADAIADKIVLEVESLRSRAIAARYRAITGKFSAELDVMGATIEGIGAHRAIGVRLIDGKRLWAYPVVGIPTAEIFNDIADKALRARHADKLILIYDHVGISDQWSAHLKWLDENIATVRAIKAREAAWDLGRYA
jgi:hypothetical protein